MTRHRTESERQTLPIRQLISGNDLFTRAADVLSPDGGATMMLASTIKAIGSTPTTVTLDELGAMLPEIERRMLQMFPPEDTRRAMSRLRGLIVSWDG